MLTERSQQPEEKARHTLIDPALKEAGWDIQHYKTANVHSSKGVAVEYFQLGGRKEADYILFVDGVAVGVVEAKKEGETLIGKEPQSEGYAMGFPEKYRHVELPLPFVYETNGVEIRFTNMWDPKPRSRELFAFHTPEELSEEIKRGKETLRYRLAHMLPIENKHLWPVQKETITKLELSLAGAKPKSLIQMATGSGKTYTATNISYRLLKHAKAKRILFLVDRTNLGIQTKQEFENFEVPKDGRKFTELYNVQQLTTNHLNDSTKVCISTIQRIYSMLKGEDLPSEYEEGSGFESEQPLQPVKVKYNHQLPIGTFDFIIVDECHRSIYKQWGQVLDYFDAFIIGLTATPSKSTIAYFDNNIVQEYSHEEAVTDNINVPFDTYEIRTKITGKGSVIKAGEVIQKRNRLTRKKRWETLEDDVEYKASDLDRRVVSKDQIRTIIRTFRDKVRTEIFPGRKYVPKTLIYAKDDNHAEEIVQIVREEFNEGNRFAVKITYKTEGAKPQDLIKAFRNEFYPRIAVTVDMIATGTDIKPLEIVFFMRPVRSRNYFEQMKGRGVRVMRNEDFMLVSPDAVAKDRFVIIDSVGVLDEDNLSETTPMEQKPNLSFEQLIKILQYGEPTEADLSSMAARLSRLQKKLTETQEQEIKELTGGQTLSELAKGMVLAIDRDRIEEDAKKLGVAPEELAKKRMAEAVRPLIGNPRLVQRLPDIRRETEILIDTVSLDEVEEAGFSELSKERAKSTIQSFEKFIEENKDELAALRLLFNNKRLDWKSLKQLHDKIKSPPYALSPSKLWRAYHQIEAQKVRGKSVNRMTDLISLLRFEIGQVNELEPFNVTVDERFSSWLKKQREMGVEFTQEQLNWLLAIKNHIAESGEITADDFELTPFNQMGGLGRAAQVLKQVDGKDFGGVLEELNEELTA